MSRAFVFPDGGTRICFRPRTLSVFAACRLFVHPPVMCGVFKQHCTIFGSGMAARRSVDSRTSPVCCDLPLPRLLQPLSAPLLLRHLMRDASTIGRIVCATSSEDAFRALRFLFEEISQARVELSLMIKHQILRCLTLGHLLCPVKLKSTH